MLTRKRKPLSEIINSFNIIPTSTLRKLVDSTSNPSSVQKLANLILEANSSSASDKQCSESVTGSGISIGSSNVGDRRKPRNGQVRTPPRAVSSTTYQYGMRTKVAAYNTRSSIKKLEKGEADISPQRIQLRKDKGNADALPFSASPSEKMKGSEPKTLNLKCLLERKNETNKENLSLLGGPPGIPIGKTDKGKAKLDASSCAVVIQDESWRFLPCCSFTKDRMEGSLKPPTSSILKRKKNVGKEFSKSSSFLAKGIEGIGKPLIPSGSSHEKEKEKVVENFQSTSIVKGTEHKGSNTAVVVNLQSARRKIESRKKSNTKYSSCPPVIKTKNKVIDLTEYGDQEDSKAWTEPRKRVRKVVAIISMSNQENILISLATVLSKLFPLASSLTSLVILTHIYNYFQKILMDTTLQKSCSKVDYTNEFPQEWIDKWKAHFKEVDEFELEVEEAYPHELD